MSDPTKKSNQIITISAAEKIVISEVDSVSAFDDDGILIISDLGKICIEGSELKIIDLNKEKKTIEIIGHIKGVFYLDKGDKKKRGIWQ